LPDSNDEHKPVRRIRSNYRSVTGIYFSSFGPVEFESQLERDAYTVLEFDSSVKGLHPQPIRIGNYVPDCQIYVHEGANILAEIKYERELDQNWLSLSEKFVRAEDYATHHGQVFGFITDTLVYKSRNLIQVLKWMKFMACRNTRSASVQGRIDKIMSGGKRIVFGALARAIEPNTKDSISGICQCVLSKSLLIASAPTIDPMDSILVAASSHSIPMMPTIFLPYRTYVKQKKSEEQYVK
jgi:hypothetical protein